MLSPETMNYIIEKMRGDSLTPLGTGKNTGKDINTMPGYQFDVVEKLAFGKKYSAMFCICRNLTLDTFYTLAYGKWELKVDSTKFYKSGFYYKTVHDGMKLYLFNYIYKAPNPRVQSRIGCMFTGDRTALSNTSAIISSCIDRASTDSYFKKAFGVKTFLDDLDMYGTK